MEARKLWALPVCAAHAVSYSAACLPRPDHTQWMGIAPPQLSGRTLAAEASGPRFESRLGYFLTCSASKAHTTFTQGGAQGLQPPASTGLSWRAFRCLGEGRHRGRLWRCDARWGLPRRPSGSSFRVKCPSVIHRTCVLLLIRRVSDSAGPSLSVARLSTSRVDRAWL